MALFHRNLYSPEGGFAPLFRLLDDFDSYSRQSSNTNNNVARFGRHIPTFQPKFDVRETEDAFELHGDLPGIAKKDVAIEFTDPNTILVRGRVERSYTTETPDSNLLEGGDKSPKKLHQATVEDEAEEGQASTTDNATTEVATKPSKAPTPKFWASERSIGEFSRSFTFPGHVQQDAVSASLKDGVLSVVIPKAKKQEARRIAVN